jgi:hypothetical protein
MMFLSPFTSLFVLLIFGMNLTAILLIFRYFAVEDPESKAS